MLEPVTVVDVNSSKDCDIWMGRHKFMGNVWENIYLRDNDPKIVKNAVLIFEDEFYSDNHTFMREYVRRHIKPGMKLGFHLNGRSHVTIIAEYVNNGYKGKSTVLKKKCSKCHGNYKKQTSTPCPYCIGMSSDAKHHYCCGGTGGRTTIDICKYCCQGFIYSYK